eukprot:CAMPEP_0116985218 /NCGR_PEP_ID=MMETSP0467-20121206/62109_1 /TAXON_ID=283647 /ORGANISM="Mesodinium pulex, Strain SPMC105" /LENGTH=168 /DNA_ID=CAMNT_0004680463 /DNA_START=1270 /DNA_END=1773 /DNA_ORIENTATION=-
MELALVAEVHDEVEEVHVLERVLRDVLVEQQHVLEVEKFSEAVFDLLELVGAYGRGVFLALQQFVGLGVDQLGEQFAAVVFGCGEVVAGVGEDLTHVGRDVLVAALHQLEVNEGHRELGQALHDRAHVAACRDHTEDAERVVDEFVVLAELLQHAVELVHPVVLQEVV